MKKIIFGILIVVFGLSLIAQTKVETTEFLDKNINLNFTSKTFENFAKYLEINPNVIKILARNIKIEAEIEKREEVSVVIVLGSILALMLVIVIISRCYHLCKNYDEDLIAIFWITFGCIFIFFIGILIDLHYLNSKIKFSESYAIEEIMIIMRKSL